MPAVWDGLTAKLTAAAGFKTAFPSGSCRRPGGSAVPDLDQISAVAMLNSVEKADLTTLFSCRSRRATAARPEPAL